MAIPVTNQKLFFPGTMKRTMVNNNHKVAIANPAPKIHNQRQSIMNKLSGKTYPLYKPIPIRGNQYISGYRRYQFNIGKILNISEISI
jgi:hypothetical protein